MIVPPLGGYETLTTLKKIEGLEKTKYVFLSAKTKTTDIQYGLSLGADKYLSKPFSMKHIISEIQSLLT